MRVAIYATDYYNLDTRNSNEGEIINLAKIYSKYLQIDINMNDNFLKEINN